MDFWDSTMKANGESGAPGQIAMMVLAGLVAIALLVVVIDDSTRLLVYLPWLLLAACPLMHIFLHRGHGHRHGGHARHGADEMAATMRSPHRPAGGES